MQLQQKPNGKNLLTAIGMMSGTSMDGIDVAMLHSDGEGIVKRSHNLEIAYAPSFKKRLVDALEDARSLKSRDERSKLQSNLETALTEQHVDAVYQFIKKFELTKSDIDLIGFHGQTVLHRPEIGMTVQLGNGQKLADETGINVVYDLRAEDMKGGGQGAPLIPIYHQALANMLADDLKAQAPVAFVNIGGISNISFMGSKDELIAFDTGPGNALIDQWVQQNSDQEFDQDGKIAATGTVDQDILQHYLADSFFEQTIPKSLDRNDFPPLKKGDMKLGDGARTLARVTAEAILISADHLPEMPKLWIICGGGRKHPVIMQDLKELAEKANSRIIKAEEAGLNGDSMEAEAWAYLAIRSVRNLPITFPTTTGCQAPTSGGVLAKASA